MPNSLKNGEFLLRDGRKVLIRLLQKEDAAPLTALFLSFSGETRKLYAPHPFDKATAISLCADVANPRIKRFVVLSQAEKAPQFIGYTIYSTDIHPDDLHRYNGNITPGKCAAIAPGVADAFQNQGVGTPMLRYILDYARQAGCRQVILMGGVKALNERGIHYYEKLGFVTVNEFWTQDPEKTINYAMVAEL